MTWLLILGLIVCCVVLMSQVSDLTARLGRVERRLTALAGAPASEPGRAAVAPNAAGTSARAAAVPREPPSLILDWKPRVAGPRIFDSLAVAAPCSSRRRFSRAGSAAPRPCRSAFENAGRPNRMKPDLGRCL